MGIFKSKSSRFRKRLLKIGRPEPNLIYNNSYYLTKLRLGVSHLCEQNFKYRFQIVLTRCVLTTITFLYLDNELSLVDSEILILNVNEKVELLLHSSSRLNQDQNYSILNAAVT